MSTIVATSYGQSTLFGTVIDEEHQPTISAVVSLLTEENVLLKATVTSNDGLFIFTDVPSGEYRIDITYLGYEDFYAEIISVANEDQNLGDLVLILSSEALSEITVVAEKPMVQVLADKTVFNVQKSLGAEGDSGFEVLRKAPGVIIDNNDAIVVEGKTGVLIYIDDKPSVLRGDDLVNYLKTIQAADIEAIEIITQPSSKFDAEGNAGIINIKLRRDKSLGTNGSLSSGITMGDLARFNNSFSLNHRDKNFNIYGSLSNRQGRSTGFINLYRTQNSTTFDAQTESEYHFNNSNLIVGLDYFVSKKSTFGVIFSGNLSSNESNSSTSTPIILKGETQPDEVLEAQSISDQMTSNMYVNLNYKLNLDNDKSFNMDFDIGQYEQDRTSLQPNRYFLGDKSSLVSEVINFMSTPKEISITTFKTDYEQNLFTGKISLGVKYSNVTTDNKFEFFDRLNNEDTLDPDRTNDFEYNELIYAAYFNYNKKLEKFSIQIGLRMEHTQSEGVLTNFKEVNNSSVSRSYTNWFPSGGLTYQLNQNNSYALIYSKRIQRPNYQRLNPFEYKIDELSYSKGNPFLQPQYTDNIKLSHTYRYRLNTSLSYSFIKDFTAQVTEAVGEDQNFLTARNVANQKVINLGISYPTSLTKWWSIYLSVNAYRSIYDATNSDFVSTEQNTLSLYAQNTFKLSNGYSAEISGWYSSPSVWGGTYMTESIGSLNLAFRKSFLNDQLSVSVGFNDILYTSPWRGTTQFGELSIIGSGGGDSRQVELNLSYRFGSNEIKKARKRDLGIEDEKGRI